MMVVRTTSGRLCEVEIVTYQGKTAAKILWALEKGDEFTREDQDEVETVINALTGMESLGSVDLGAVPKTAMDAAANRYLKAEDN
jgi:hypothetical protein